MYNDSIKNPVLKELDDMIEAAVKTPFVPFAEFYEGTDTVDVYLQDFSSCDIPITPTLTISVANNKALLVGFQLHGVSHVLGVDGAKKLATQLNDIIAAGGTPFAESEMSIGFKLNGR